jgi:hypothetical protein
VADLNINSNMRFERAGAAMVASAAEVLYKFSIADNSNIGWTARKTTDASGSPPTWGGALDSTNDPNSYPGGVGISAGSAWWRDWTNGLSGETVVHHAFYSKQATNGITYWSFDISDDTWSGPNIILADTSADAAATIEEAQIYICEVQGGNIYILVYSAGTPRFYRSTDGGTNWTSRSIVGLPTPTTNNITGIKLCPGPFADSDDVCAIIYNGDDNTVKAYHYDNSGDAWSSGVAMLTGVQHNTTVDMQMAMSAVPRHSDDAILFGMSTEPLSAATGDGVMGVLTGEGPQVYTAKTDLWTNKTNMYFFCLTLDANTDNIIAAYIGSEADDEDDFGAWLSYTKTSEDGGGTWGAETQMHETLDDLRGLAAPLVIPSGQAGYYAPLTHNDDLNDLLYPVANSFAVAAVSSDSSAAARPAMAHTRFRR